MKRKKFILLGALSLIFALFGSTWAQDENDDLKHVRKASEKYRASLKKGNWEQVFAMYTEDAVNMPPNQIFSKGKRLPKRIGWRRSTFILNSSTGKKLSLPSVGMSRSKSPLIPLSSRPKAMTNPQSGLPTNWSMSGRNRTTAPGSYTLTCGAQTSLLLKRKSARVA